MKSRTLRILSEISRLILSATFLVSGFTKVVDPWGTAIKINEYLSIYGFEFLEPASMAFSIWLCGAEMMMGCMLLFRVRIRLVSIFVLASMLFFTGLTLLSATIIPVEDCGCFGEALKLTPWQTFIKNLVLLPLAWTVWYRYRHDRIFAFRRAEVVLTLFFFLLTMGLGTWCYRHLPLVDFLPYKVGVNIFEAMHAPVQQPDEQVDVVLVYRNRLTGEQREFSLDQTEWQDAATWEWVDTRTSEPPLGVRPLIAEFALRDAEGDATEELLTQPGLFYLVCVTDFNRLGPRCTRRLERLAARAVAEGAGMVCVTPQPMHEVTWRRFGSSRPVRCYNIDAATMQTMLRARNGVVELLDGVIVAKRNCRDIDV